MDMLCVFVCFCLSFNFISSFEIKISAEKEAGKQHEPAASLDSGVQLEKRQIDFSPVIPDEVKDEFKQYAKNYLNSMVTEISEKTPKKEENTKRARICAEVCQHRCLPSCEWSCCIKENIEEYRSAHLVKPLVNTDHAAQRKSHLATADENTRNDNAQNKVGNKRAHFAKLRENQEEVLKDGHECNPSCKRYCVPSCRFACCQPVQIKGVLLF